MNLGNIDINADPENPLGDDIQQHCLAADATVDRPNLADIAFIQ
jgi:hypothetical protein